MNEFSYRVVVGEAGPIAVKVSARDVTHGMMIALCSVAKIRDIPIHALQSSLVRSGSSGGLNRSWRFHIPSHGGVQVTIADDLCGTASPKLDTRVSQLLHVLDEIDTVNTMLSQEDILIALPDPVDVVWLIENGYLAECHSYRSSAEWDANAVSASVNKIVNDVGDETWILAENAVDGSIVGDRIPSDRVVVELETTDKLDDLRDLKPACSCIHGQAVHCPVSGACLYTNPTYGPCPCAATPPMVRISLTHAHRKTREID